ncbi:MAG: transcription termination factor Rho [Sedimentisphaerales bacterium]|jgi:transcription termination factor Rho|nr:transcription termination factor Rho [Sedimentisphaerales bacterium]
MTQTITGIIRFTHNKVFAVRVAKNCYRMPDREITIHPSLVSRYHLTEGATVTGQVENKAGKQRLVTIESLGGMPPEQFYKRPRFSDLVALDPQRRFDLGASGEPSMRIVDLIAPIGRGSRQLIVSPPRGGKTVLLEQMARAIRQDSPDVRVIVLLIDERPEEVTNFRREVPGVEVIASTSDHTADEHADLAELMLAHVQTELECGRHIVLMIDSLTRIGRAFNNRTRWGGQARPTMTGGLEAGVLEVPRRLFGLARNVENGGSVTIVATCLVDTGSKMDQLIFEEFKGTGNSEIVLSRSIAEARVFPAIDIPASGTRKEMKLYGPGELKAISALRRVLSSYGPKEAIEALHKLLARFPTNQMLFEYLASLKSEGV